jgi:hypothetical protein
MRKMLFVLAVLCPGVALAAAGDNSIAGGGAATDRSGTIATGGVSQPIMATNPNRVGCELQVISGELWVSFNVAASNATGSWKLPAGTYFNCAPVVPTGALNGFSTVAGATFTAVEYQR